MKTDVLSLLRATDRRTLVAPDAGWALTGDEVVDRVERLAAQLTRAGVRPGEVVGLVLGPGPGAILAFLATLRCNAIAAPLNPLLHAHEMVALLRAREPVLLVLEDEVRRAAGEAAVQLGVGCVALTSGHEPRLLGVDNGRVDRLPDPDPEAVALLLHTSGTTGAQKAVPLRQRNLAASASTIAASYELSDRDVSYCLMPLFHVHGLIASALAALAAGGAIVAPERPRPGALWTHAAEHGLTWVSAVPTVLGKLPARPDQTPATLRFVRSCSSALAASMWAELEERLDAPVVEAYGMTEASHQIATNQLPPGERRPGTVGVPTGTEVTVVDADDWRPLAPGMPGEVMISGPGVVDAYLDNDEANFASFRDGWFRTGDLGRLAADGYLTLEGRLKELINRGGEKIAPWEVDDALLRHPSVLEAVAFGRADPKWGEVVEAAVVLRSSVTPATLRAHCAELLAGFKVPRTVHVVDEIPRGVTGKVERRRIVEVLGS